MLRSLPILALATLSTVATWSCSSLEPPEALVNLQTDYGEVYGTSTEAGILVLSELTTDKDELSFRYHVGTGAFDDVARVDRRNDWLAVLQPVSSRPNQVRLAMQAPDRDETLYLETRDEDGEPRLLEASLLQGGDRGDLLVLTDGPTAARAATDFAGGGVYVEREGHLQLAGVLNGVYLDSPAALAFIGIEEISRILPDSNPYFERKSLLKRSDFEYGVPRDLRGENPGAAGFGPVPPRAGQSEPPTGTDGVSTETTPGLEELLRALESDGSGG